MHLVFVFFFRKLCRPFNSLIIPFSLFFCLFIIEIFCAICRFFQTKNSNKVKDEHTTFKNIYKTINRKKTIMKPEFIFFCFKFTQKTKLFINYFQ